MIEIEVRPHNVLDFVQKLVQAEYDTISTPAADREFVKEKAFTRDELQEITEHLMIYLRHKREET